MSTLSNVDLSRGGVVASKKRKKLLWVQRMVCVQVSIMERLSVRNSPIDRRIRDQEYLTLKENRDGSARRNVSMSDSYLRIYIQP